MAFSIFSRNLPRCDVKKIVDPWSQFYARRVESLKTSATRDLMGAASRPDIISFAGGLPSPETFDAESVERIAREILSTDGARALQYSPTEGLYELREQICALLARNGLHAHPDEIIITSGAQQALDILGKLFLEPGAEAIIEAPSYVGALNAFQVYEPHFFAVPLEDDGMDIDALRAHLEGLSATPRFIYTVPNFHNPAGVTLSLEKRQELVRIAREAGMILIEDNPYGELVIEGEQLPTLRSFDESIIYLGTLSKILSPGLRIGWVFAQPPIIQKVNAAKQGADLCSSTLNQLIAARFLETIDFDAHVRKIREIYRVRRDAMLAALEEFFPEEASWTRPAGGFFLWVTIDADINTTDLLSEALARKVAFVPGEGFYVDGSGQRSMRLSYSNPSPEEIWEGIERLAEVIKGQIVLSRMILGVKKNKRGGA
jgi:2-aminoadipate transaminase